MALDKDVPGFKGYDMFVFKRGSEALCWNEAVSQGRQTDTHAVGSMDASVQVNKRWLHLAVVFRFNAPSHFSQSAT